MEKMVIAKKRDHKRHVTNSEPLHRRTCLFLCTYAHCVIFPHTAPFILARKNSLTGHISHNSPQIKTFSLSVSLFVSFLFIKDDALLTQKKKSASSYWFVVYSRVCLTPDGERASFLALVCLVSPSQPIALLRCSVPSWFRPLIIEPEASRAPCLPARTRERQHRLAHS